MIEVQSNGLTLEPFTTETIKTPLGPGYKPGWWAWTGLGGRVDNCDLSKINPENLAKLGKRYEQIIQISKRDNINYELYLKYVERYYHNLGHTIISKDCKTEDTGASGHAVMSFSEVSARDPIFFRWHGHLEVMLQNYRDTKLPSYTLTDFQLTDDIKVSSIKTIIDEKSLKTENNLITHMEEVTIDHGHQTSISYRRLNHVPFKYQINIDNPNQSNKKVLVRIWLGVISDPETK